MEKKPIKRKAIWLTGLAMAAIITTVAVASQNKNGFGIPGQPLFRTLSDSKQDTLPKKGKAKPKQEIREDDSFDSRDLDKALEDVKKSLQKLKIELKKADSRYYDEYMDKFRSELDAAFDHEDWEMYNNDMRKAMKELEHFKWDALAPPPFKAEEWNKYSDEMGEAMKELNKVQLLHEKDLLMKELDMEKLNKEMEKAKWELEENQEKMKFDFEHLGEDLKKAKIDMERAHIELKNLKSLMREFEKDGLIKKGKAYEIKIEKGNLYIDGKKQPDNITDKYRKDERFKTFFDKDNNFNMNSDGKDEDDWL